MVNNNNFTNDNVKYLRELNNISQSKMAKDLRIDQSTLAKWENGTRQITLDWAIKIADYFDITVGEFISKDFIHNVTTNLPSSESEYKKILKDKGLLDENDNVDIEKLNEFNKKIAAFDEFSSLIDKFNKNDKEDII